MMYLLAAILATGLRHDQDSRRLILGQVPRDLAEGLRFARGHTIIGGVLLVTIAMNLLGFPYCRADRADRTAASSWCRPRWSA